MGAAVQLKAGQNGETPLHTASRIENGYKCAEMLIKSGAQINAIEDVMKITFKTYVKILVLFGQNGETPLHFVARHGFLPTAKLLLEDKANCTLQNNLGENVLQIAVKNCHYPIAESILQNTIENYSKDDAKKLVNQANKVCPQNKNHKMFYKSVSFESNPQSGESSVHYAANLLAKTAHYVNEDRDMMRLLLQNGGNPMLETNEVFNSFIKLQLRIRLTFY